MNFENKKRLAVFDTVSAALATYYKRDRLADADKDALVADTERWMGEEGHACLASRHESVTGRPLWIRPEREGFVVYEG